MHRVRRSGYWRLWIEGGSQRLFFGPLLGLCQEARIESKEIWIAVGVGVPRAVGVLRRVGVLRGAEGKSEGAPLGSDKSSLPIREGTVSRVLQWGKISWLTSKFSI